MVQGWNIRLQNKLVITDRASGQNIYQIQSVIEMVSMSPFSNAF